MCIRDRFNTLYSFFAAICIPYWSKTTIAFAENDYKWVRNAIKGLYRICFIFVLMYIIAAIVFKPVVALWLGRELDYQPGLIEVMCLYYILFSIVALNTHIINGTGKINFQVVLMSFLGVINIPLSVFFAKEIGLGVVGVRLATTILILSLIHISEPTRQAEISYAVFCLKKKKKKEKKKQT